MRVEQDYFIERLRRHNRLLHGWGIICGLQVLPDATAEQPWRVKVCPGAAFRCHRRRDRRLAPGLVRPRAPTRSDRRGLSPMSVSARAAAARQRRRPRDPLPRDPIRVPSREARTHRPQQLRLRRRRLRDQPLARRLRARPADQARRPVRARVDRRRERLVQPIRGTEMRDRASIIGLPTRPCPPPTVYPWVIIATVTADLSAPPPDAAANPNRRTTSLDSSAPRPPTPRKSTAARWCAWRIWSG
jgi:hypothetical protein